MENRATLGRMVTLVKLIFGFLADLFRSRAALETEILVLRQQIIVLRRGKPARLPIQGHGQVGARLALPAGRSVDRSTTVEPWVKTAVFGTVDELRELLDKA